MSHYTRVQNFFVQLQSPGTYDNRSEGTHNSEKYENTNSETSLATSSASGRQGLPSGTRKRKPSSYGTESTFEDDGTDDTNSTRNGPEKKQSHSEIEKRRRDKMNTYISELSMLIPMCGAMSRKMDKLTVLKMAVQHLRTVRGSVSPGPLTTHPRPAFLSEQEINSLVLQLAHDSFLLVVGCDRGRLLYVSASVSRMLQYDQSELMGQSLFDILHPRDVAKVKEQFSSSDLYPRERLIDAKTMLPVKPEVAPGTNRLCLGARRSFFCRIKCRASDDVSLCARATGPDPSLASVDQETGRNTEMRKKLNEKKYCIVQCTGYLKSWGPVEMEGGGSLADVGAEDGEGSNPSCLVAIGRALTDISPVHNQTISASTKNHAGRLQYTSRHATDGKFLFVDHRVTLALGFLPQELIGTSLYEYVSAPELTEVARTHKEALLNRGAMHTPLYSFRKKDGTKVRIKTQFKPFRNPWTKDVDCLVANNTVVLDSYSSPKQDTHALFGVFKQEGDAEVQRLIESHVESRKIGSSIAEEALCRSSSDFTPELPADLMQNVAFNQQVLGDNILDVDMGNHTQIRNNVALTVAQRENSIPSENNGELPATTIPPPSPTVPSLSVDGNGEATMAVIMSLLEADAGLGGPVNFTGLPWPLP